jgi:hypothetical protein
VAVDVDDPDRVIRQIADDVRRGRCILFLGAAVHAPPPKGSRFVYPETQRPPLGSALSRSLAESLELSKLYPDEDPTNLQRVALIYEIDREGGRADLVTAIRRAVHIGKQPSPVVRALAELDFPRVVTTNYDKLFEVALYAAGKTPRVTVYDPARLKPTEDPPSPTPEDPDPIFYKLHGDIDQTETIVVTDEDYIHFLYRMLDRDRYDPVPLKLKADLTEKTTLFVGYSLLDYNFRLFFKALRWGVDQSKLPAIYAVDYKPDPVIRRVAEGSTGSYVNVKFVVQDVWAFVPQLYELVLGKAMRD